MGKKGKEIVEEYFRAEELVEELNRAIANEWSAAYFYWVSSKVAEGFHGEEVAEFFSEQVEEEIKHADMLAERVIELGGTPVESLGKIDRLTRSVDLPSDYSDAEAFLNKALEIEREVIDYYNKLANKYLGKDHRSYKVVTDILSAEIREEEKIENLLGSKKK